MNKILLTDVLSAIGRANNSIYCFGRWLAEGPPDNFQVRRTAKSHGSYSACNDVTSVYGNELTWK